MHAKAAHIVERHRLAGWVLGFAGIGESLRSGDSTGWIETAAPAGGSSQSIPANGSVARPKKKSAAWVDCAPVVSGQARGAWGDGNGRTLAQSPIRQMVSRKK
jgi:hypothetical protein